MHDGLDVLHVRALLTAVNQTKSTVSLTMMYIHVIYKHD